MMNFITSLSFILSLIFSISHELPLIPVIVENSNPVIVVTQGVLEKESFLPISVLWYLPKFTEGNSIIVRYLNNKTKYADSFLIDRYTGFHELPLTAVQHGETPGNYCAVFKSNEEDFYENSSCESKIQWMYDLRHVLKFFTLKDLVIPGTHDSAAYKIDQDESLRHQSPRLPWILSQTKSITTQLMDGIRYLDFKPTLRYVKGRAKYFLTHNEWYLAPLDDIVKEIKKFMNLSKDIVIVSFKGFHEGFNSDQDHLDFMDYLELSFLNYAHERTNWTHTLNQFWTADRRLILSYDHEIHKSSRFMWPPITHYWGDVQTINQLHSYLAAVHQNHVNDSVPYAGIVDFAYSPAPSTLNFFSQGMNLQAWTERLSPYILRWYAGEWKSSANIILVNFYQTSGIVDVAIQLNEKRANYPIGLQPYIP